MGLQELLKIKETDEDKPNRSSTRLNGYFFGLKVMTGHVLLENVMESIK